MKYNVSEVFNKNMSDNDLKEVINKKLITIINLLENSFYER